MKLLRVALLVVIAFTFLTPVATAEDIKNIFSNVEKYVAAKNFPKALEELGWARKEIEKMNSTAIQDFFPDKLAGLDGQDFKAASGFGMNNIERVYKGTDNSRVTVSLVGGTSSGAQGAFGGLAAMGRMAALAGNQPGSETFRVEGKTANLKTQEDRNRAELTVFLDSGSFIKFELRNSSDSDVLKKMAEGIKLNDLDNYLRGVS